MTLLPAGLLPVLDLKQGQAVHAVAGDRDNYRPLQSSWTPKAHQPLELAHALFSRLGLNEFYVADLDAIEQTGSHRELILQLLEQGCRLWLDAGVRSMREADAWMETGVDRLILASESLPSLELLRQSLARHGSERIVFSLDFCLGKVRSSSGFFTASSPEGMMEELHRAGVSQFILLDVASVGTSSGPPLVELCRWARRTFPEAALISGGGVRSRDDILALHDAGVHRVLVSSWLHRQNPGMDENAVGK